MKRFAVNLIILACASVPLAACGSSATVATSPNLGRRIPRLFGSPVNVQAVTQALTKVGIHGLRFEQIPPTNPIFVLVVASRPGPGTLWVSVSSRPFGTAANIRGRGGLPNYVEGSRPALQHINVKNLAIVYVAKGGFLTKIRAAISALKR